MLEFRVVLAQSPACQLTLCQTSSDLMEAKAQQGSRLDPLAPAGRSELTSSLSGSPCLEQTLALMHSESLNVELLRSSKLFVILTRQVFFFCR